MKVLKYIDYLNNLFEENSKLDPHIYYNRGGCYEFAHLLKLKFPQGKIAVTEELMHVVFFYKNKYYDVDGEFFDTEDIIATEDELPPTVWKIIKSYEFNEKTNKPKRNYIKVYDEFSFDEQEEIAEFCEKYECNLLLEELEWREI